MNTPITRELALHPLCTLFPRLTGAEFDALKADILANGQREPIVVHDGLVLDGGNRYQACVEAGVEPIVKEYTGADPVAYVLSANLHRRHLTPGQQAAIVARAQNWANAQSVGNPAFKAAAQSGNVAGLSTVADRAAQSGASERTQRMADKVAKESPELAEQVAHGEISLPKALEQLAPKAETPPKASAWPFPNPSPGSPAAEHNASIEAEADDLYDQAVAVVLKDRRASVSLVQRHLRIGYNRAARLIEQMEQKGLVSPMQSNGDRLIMAPLPLEQGEDEDEDDDEYAAEQDDAQTTAQSIADEGHEQLLADYNLVVARNVELLQRIAALTQDDLALQVDALALKCAQFDSLATTRFNEIAELKTVVERQRSFLDGLRRAAGLPKGGDLLTWIKHAAQRAA